MMRHDATPCQTCHETMKKQACLLGNLDSFDLAARMGEGVPPLTVARLAMPRFAELRIDTLPMTSQIW